MKTSLIERLDNLIKSLSIKAQTLKWDEDFQTVSILFKGKVDAFIQSFREYSEDPTEENVLSIEANIEGLLFYDCQFFDTYENGFLEEEKEIEVRIRFNKQISLGLDPNTVVFFQTESFMSLWNFENEQTLSFFKYMDHGKYGFIYLSEVQTHRNEYIMVKPLKEFVSHLPVNLSASAIEKQQKVIEIREDLTRINPDYPIPYMFKINSANGKLQEKFNQNLFFLCLLHLSNKYKEDTFVLRGQKNIEIKWRTDFIPQNVNILFKVFNFSFGKDQTEDKLEIARNIFTIYSNDDSLEKFDLELVRMEKTIHRHFSLYVNDKINKFFKDTKSAVEEAHKYAKEVREAADKIANNINTSILALITAIFTGIVAMSKGTLLYLYIALGLHVLYFLLSFYVNKHFALKRKKDIKSVYEASNKYFSNITDEEKEEINNTYVVPAMGGIDKNLKLYCILTYSFLALIILLLVLIWYNPNTFLLDDQQKSKAVQQPSTNNAKPKSTAPNQTYQNSKIVQPSINHMPPKLPSGSQMQQNSNSVQPSTNQGKNISGTSTSVKGNNSP